MFSLACAIKYWKKTPLEHLVRVFSIAGGVDMIAVGLSGILG